MKDAEEKIVENLIVTKHDELKSALISHVEEIEKFLRGRGINSIA